ncbi:BatD family protein [Haloferula rosea]|uniref:BatD family protein n=2 Tax=Haloferula rosea TaxID=490093 RepID=A0A934RA87_9BACT|nr:BatD family protein [Haloferula rosea]
MRLLIPLLACLSAALEASPLSARMSSQFLVEGEQATLEYVISDGLNPRAQLKLTPVDGLEIRSVGLGAEPRIAFGRRREYVFRFMVTSYTPGNYTIPAARLIDDAGEILGPEVKVRVFKETELQWSTAQAGGRSVRYAAGFHTIDDTPFVKEVIPTELKLYIPTDQRVEDWGIPEFQRDGVAAWRFEPRPSLGRANLLGRSYYAVSYPSTLSPTRSGMVTLGPAKLRLITVQTSVQNFNAAFYEPLNVVIPELNLASQPLPAGAPEGFEDAVGDFELSVTTSDSEVREGDPVNVNLVVSGAGNLDTLNAPKPIDTEGWKLYPASSVQRDDRRDITGFAAFRQFMRPLIPQNQIPPFRLVFFNPETETYRTILSPAIPLKVLPSTAAPSMAPSVPMALPMPIEEMTDILGLTRAGMPLLPETRMENVSRYWQIIPAILALILLFRIAQLHLFPKLKPDPERVARRKAIKELEKAPAEELGFYRTAGHFVEEWLGNSNDELVKDVLTKRDQTCFTGDADSAPVPRSERQRIVRGLRRLMLPLIVVIAGTTADLRADDEVAAEPAPEVTAPEMTAQEAYDSNSFKLAARLWLESGPYERLSPDTLYNIGNAAYRLGSPGEAALYWRRALTRDSSHPEARQNLRFLERKFGSITIKRPDYQYTLAKIPLAGWKSAIWAGGWIIVLSLLVFPATRPMARMRIAAISGLVAAPILIGAGVVGHHFYPDDARFAALEEQAVVTADRASIRTDAARNAPLVLEAPAGSLCRVLKETGDWVYIAFTNETRGWIAADQVKMLIPEAQPEPPTPPSSTSSDESKSA